MRLAFAIGFATVSAGCIFGPCPDNVWSAQWDEPGIFDRFPADGEQGGWTAHTSRGENFVARSATQEVTEGDQTFHVVLGAETSDVRRDSVSYMLSDIYDRKGHSSDDAERHLRRAYAELGLGVPPGAAIAALDGSGHCD